MYATAANKLSSTLLQTHGPEPIGISPCDMTGKMLRSIRPSESHPALTLQFSDNTTYQVRVDGYNPSYPGLPKQIEMSPGLQDLLKRSSEQDLNLTVLKATIINLEDRGYQGGRDESSWMKRHAGIALQFDG